MKKLLTILMIIVSFNCFSRGGGMAHSSGHISEGGGGHFSESGSESHTSSSFHEEETSIPRESINDNDIHYNPQTFVYYYLLLNHHTNTYDTVYAKSKDELKDKLSDNILSSGVIVEIVIGVVLVILVLFILFK